MVGAVEAYFSVQLNFKLNNISINVSGNCLFLYRFIKTDLRNIILSLKFSIDSILNTG